MHSDAAWYEPALWEKERIRAEVWLNTNAWGYEWSVNHYLDGDWHTIDSGLERSTTSALHHCQRVIGEICG